jgi:endo-1,4-beta-xylanase
MLTTNVLPVVNGTWGKDNLTAVMIDHVVTEMSHYKEKCYAWDVVNEALNDNGTLRSDMWLDIIGPEYITIAFEHAAKADPSAKLYYNEYDIEFKGPKHDGALRVVKMIQDAGLRIDGIGFQSHFTPATAPGLEEQLDCMKDFTDLGLELAVTEMDVRILIPDSPTELQQQKETYVNTVEACLQTEKCVGMTVWDFWDQVRSLLLLTYISTKAKSMLTLTLDAVFVDWSPHLGSLLQRLWRGRLIFCKLDSKAGLRWN